MNAMFFFSRNQDSGESIDHYVTVLKNLANTCEFGALKESLIRDRIVFGIQDSSVRERLLRDAKLTLETAIEKVRSSELTQIQLKQIKADKTTDESISAITTKPPEKLPSKFPMIDCKFCGRRHPRNKNLCPAYGSKCQKCGLANHFAKKCRTKETRQPRTGKRLHLVEIEDDTEDEFAIDMVTHEIGSLNTKSNDDVATQLFVTMMVNDSANIKFQLDCGATCNLLPLKDYARVMGDPDDLYIEKSKAKLTMYNGAVMYPVGKCKLKCTRDGSSHVLEFQVVDGEVRPLLSAELCQRLNFLKVLVKDPLHHVDTVTRDSQYTPSTSETIIDDDILTEYADVFEGLGCLTDPYHIEIDPTAQPVIHPPRKVPVTLREPLRQELKRMEENNILAPVSEATDWVSSMVTVVKPNKLRICIDPKDLNRAIKRPHYPLPTIEEVATKLSKAKVFSVLDAKSGFWQVPLDEASSKLTTFNTPFGRFRWLRMPFGISSAPEEFQKRMNDTFGDIKGTAVIADDLLVYGEGDDMETATSDHDKNLRIVLERAREINLTLNKDKVRLRLTEVPYIGHLLTADGLKPDPKKVEAIVMMPQPTDVQAVKRFLGMANYLSKFLPHLSTVTEPLRRLENKDVEWHWDEVHERAFTDVKRLITSHPLLRYYDVSKEVTLQCDASQSGLGAALLQDGQPVAFTSRSLTTTEKNYAQIEKELLAIVHACERFDQYLFGREVTVETDHKPLEAILKKPLLTAPKRLQRMMMRLQNYQLKVVYKRGQEMYIADTLSRAYLPVPDHISQNEMEFIRSVEEVDMTKHLAVTRERLADFQQNSKDNPALQLLKRTIELGWPERREAVPSEIHAFYSYRDELTVQDEILFRGNRVIVPASMRSEMLKKIHASHIGIEGCLRRAREILYWPGMTSAIRDHVSACGTCNSFRMEQPKEPLMPQKVPDRPWSKVAVDLFTLHKTEYIIVVDDYSNFFELRALSDTRASSVITSLKSQFARHGIPNIVRSDNGSKFSSDFKTFAREWDFEHITSSPYHARSNGKVEKAVNTAKRILKKAVLDHKDPYLALLDWRNTPTEGLDSSPVQRLMGRRTRTLLPTSARLLKPKLPKPAKDLVTKKREKQAHYYNKGAKRLKELKPGDIVRMKPDPKDRKRLWKKATCLQKVAPRSYEVDIEGTRYRRNRKDLIATRESPAIDSRVGEPDEPPLADDQSQRVLD